MYLFYDYMYLLLYCIILCIIINFFYATISEMNCIIITVNEFNIKINMLLLLYYITWIRYLHQVIKFIEGGP